MLSEEQMEILLDDIFLNIVTDNQDPNLGGSRYCRLSSANRLAGH